ncbi:MAG TPA: LapA family protein [bacterium]|nr:LapA family protein [bacterium]
MSFWKRPKFILWTLAVVLVVTVVLQNVEPTRIRFLFWSFLAVPKLVLILVSMLVGAVASLLIGWSFGSGKDPSDDKEDTNSEGVSPPTLH